MYLLSLSVKKYSYEANLFIVQHGTGKKIMAPTNDNKPHEKPVFMQSADHVTRRREAHRLEAQLAVRGAPPVVDAHDGARQLALCDVGGQREDLALADVAVELRPRAPDRVAHHAQLGRLHGDVRT